MNVTAVLALLLLRTKINANTSEGKVKVPPAMSMGKELEPAKEVSIKVGLARLCITKKHICTKHNDRRIVM